MLCHSTEDHLTSLWELAGSVWENWDCKPYCSIDFNCEGLHVLSFVGFIYFFEGEDFCLSYILTRLHTSLSLRGGELRRIRQNANFCKQIKACKWGKSYLLLIPFDPIWTSAKCDNDNLEEHCTGLDSGPWIQVISSNVHQSHSWTSSSSIWS